MANHFSHAALPYPIKKARFTLEVPYLDADGDPTDPTTPDTEVSKDAAAFADCAEEVATISGSNGVGYITLTGAEMDCTMLALAAKVASGPKNTLATLYPRVLAIVGSGTLSAGSAGGGTLGTILGYDVTGCFIRTTGGTGGGGTGGANNQARKIVTYNTSTGAFTVEPNWETTPDNTTTYDVLLPEGLTLGVLQKVDATVSSRASQTSVDTVDDFLDTEIAAIKAKTDNLPADPADASDIASSFTTVNTKLDTIDDFLDTEIAAIKAKTDNLPSDPADASDIAASFTTVNTKLDTIDDFLDTEVAAIKAKTDNLPTDPADQSAVEAAITAATSGLATQASVNTIDDFLDTEVAAIKAKTDNLPADPADASDIAASFATVAASIATLSALVDDLEGRLTSTRAGYLDNLGAALTESYAADGADATLTQLLYEIRGLLSEFAISGTTLTMKKKDGSTTAATYTLNDASAPTAITRAT
jgi:hypothetical protein